MVSRHTEKINRRKLQNKIQPSKIILIVVEGKTEEKYFSNFKSDTFNIIILNNKGGDKPTFINFTRQCIKEYNKKNIEELWLVFDRDVKLNEINNKSKYDNAFSTADAEGWHIAHSNDAFELWILLHFIFIDTCMHRTQLISSLKNHILNYDKGESDIYNKTISNINIAISNAEKLEIYGTDCPSTAIHKLINRLTSIE